MSTQSIYSLPAVAATPDTADAAHRARDLRRLLACWRALGARLVVAQAHGGADEAELADAVASIEDALRLRHPQVWRAVQPELDVVLLEAEHSDRFTSPADCLICRRLAGGGLPISVEQLAEAGRA